jgi:hypothetical protein
MRKLLIWGAVGMLTAVLLYPLLYFMHNQPIPWIREMLMAASGLTCFYLYLCIKTRNEVSGNR